jgi:hypothetical protein
MSINSKIVKNETKIRVFTRAVARPWWERRLPRAPDFRERKKNKCKLKNTNLMQEKIEVPW